MNSKIQQDNYRHISLMTDANTRSSIAYQTNRTAITVFNMTLLAGAEAYINGLEVSDHVLKSLLQNSVQICYKNFPSLLVPYEWLSEETDCLAERSQELMKIHYDLPEKMFRLMLGERKLMYPKYSMALWEKGALNLEQAQMDMLDDVIEKVGIKDGDEILDLGCGWGAAPNYILAQFPNVKVTGLSLSHEQCEYMRKKMQNPESYLSSERFTLYEEDFNDAKFETKFDKVITFGVFEHIGNLTKSFAKLASFLKDDGKVFIHIISTTFPYNITNPFIDKYIFPNMRVWSYDSIPTTNKNLKTINRWYLNGVNYSETLKIWLRNFNQNQVKIKDLNYGMSYAKFRRLWRLYLLLCIAHFDGCNGEIIGNGQYLLVHA